MGSVWSETIQIAPFAPQKQDIKTDVLVTGGGMAGILCAWTLHRAGVRCVLVEAKRVCGGTTENTTAKITAQHGLIFEKLIRTVGAEHARLYLQANLQAVELYREICQDIDCDFADCDNYIYSTQGRERLERELAALEKLGYAAKFVREVPLPMQTAGAICFERQAQFHPLKFLRAITKDLRIFENTEVLELRKGEARTNRGTIRAENIIVATHFPFLNKHGGYFLKMYQQRSYVLALKGAPPVGGMYLDGGENGLSFRDYGQYLLLGGGGHRTGMQGGGWQELRAFAQRHYPQAQIVSQWAAQDCMTLDGMPYIGQYGKRTPNLYAATGFGKWGMTSSMVAAQVLKDLVLGRQNPYAELFSPSRTMYKPQLARNAAHSALHLLKPTAPRCPHLGCALEYNAQEHSWDCPCHGSRFAADGTLLDNPATGGLKKPKTPPIDASNKLAKRSLLVLYLQHEEALT